MHEAHVKRLEGLLQTSDGERIRMAADLLEAEIAARQAALQYLSDTGQMMDRIAAMEADKAAAVEAMQEAAIAACMTQKTKFADATKSGWERGNDSGTLGCAAAIRALSPPPAARGQDVEALVKAAKYAEIMCRLDFHDRIDWECDDFSQAVFDTWQRLCAALAPFTEGKE